MSAVEIEWRLFNASRQIGGRGTGVDSGGVETFMAQQLRQLDQSSQVDELALRRVLAVLSIAA
jgi:hypothetical protein